MYEVNKIHCADWMQNGLPDKSVHLFIADPPYFEVKGEFDFIWKSFDEYLADVEKWAKEAKRLMADNGTLFWYGDAKNIAYSQIILDRHFTLLNNIVWEKEDCQTLKNEIAAMRRFIPVTERLLMYGIGEDKSSLQMIADDPQLYMPLKEYFDQEHDKTGMSLKEITVKFGSTCSHYFGFSKRDKTQFIVPTKEMWEKLQTTGHFQRSHESIVAEFKELTDQYDKTLGFEEKRRYFKLPYSITDVFHFSQESHLTKNYDHPTKKPETLTRTIIHCCSKPEVDGGGLVFIPFAGSGTECAMAATEGRPFIGFDIDPKHVQTSNERVAPILKSPKLFV